VPRHPAPRRAGPSTFWKAAATSAWRRSPRAGFWDQSVFGHPFRRPGRARRACVQPPRYEAGDGVARRGHVNHHPSTAVTSTCAPKPKSAARGGPPRRGEFASKRLLLRSSRPPRASRSPQRAEDCHAGAFSGVEYPHLGRAFGRGELGRVLPPAGGWQGRAPPHSAAGPAAGRPGGPGTSRSSAAWPPAPDPAAGCPVPLPQGLPRRGPRVPRRAKVRRAKEEANKCAGLPPGQRARAALSAVPPGPPLSGVLRDEGRGMGR
jgi:hypothetical protein